MDILIWADLHRMLYQTREAYLPFVSAKEGITKYMIRSHFTCRYQNEKLTASP